MAIEVGLVRVFETSEFEIGMTRICSHARNSNGKIMKILREGLLIGICLPTKSHVIPCSGCWALKMCAISEFKIGQKHNVSPGNNKIDKSVKILG